MTLILKTPEDAREDLAGRAKAIRLGMNLTQKGLAKRAGISPGTIKRFEKTGHISMDSLLKLALVLGALEEFYSVFKLKIAAPSSIDELFEKPRARERGSLK